MYHQYFGLTEAPFSIAVNPRYLYMSPRHRDALAHLLYGVGAGGGFILLTGEVGTGKTTINRCLLEQLPDAADIAIVLNPALDARDLLATVCEELGIEFDEDRPGLKALTDSLHRYLLANHEAGRKTVLMIDEAQHLGFEVLEQIRLLTNLETNEEKLLHIILIGQPELSEKLNQPALRQLNQRITARFELRPLSVSETGAYIRHRLHVAGLPAGTELFSPSLVRAIHRQSRGIPRLINLLCDRMLLGAYGKSMQRLDRSLLRSAAKEVAGAPGEPRRLRWLLPAAVGSAIAMLGVVLWAVFTDDPTGDRVAERAVPANGVAPMTQRLTPTSSDPLNTVGRTSGSEVASVEVEPGADIDTSPLTAEQPKIVSQAPRDWLMSPEAGAASLLALYGVDAAGGRSSPCQGDLPDELRCEVTQARSWNTLENEGRPALLSLLDDTRRESRALFLGTSGDDAMLAGTGGTRRVPLGDLAALWTGDAWFLWRTLAGVNRTLKRGDSGPDVRAVADLFAAIDAQPEPLTDTLFTAAMETRVRLFQQAVGLNADGVLGERTLRALMIAAGRDLSIEEALQQSMGKAGAPSDV
ncbi:MAG: AAA family ATPase [Pseudomonadota bacterium]